ncbi:MAG: hypothetical protein QXL94_01070 [Candidatus Parvarchaeum sp.]
MANIKEVQIETPDFIVGIPAGHLGYTTFWMHLIRWMANNPVMPIISESNRVDVNRSQIIDAALKTKRNVLFLDHDALPMTAYPDVCKMLLEDFKTYDIVVAPVRGMDGQILVKPLTADFKFPQHSAEYLPFEIEAGSFTLAGISYNLLKQLKPISHYGLVNGQEVPLYVQYTNQTSEEYAFCKRAKKMYNSKIACDPRIKVAHYKTIPLQPPFSQEELKEMSKQRQEQKEEPLKL